MLWSDALDTQHTPPHKLYKIQTTPAMAQPLHGRMDVGNRKEETSRINNAVACHPACMNPAQLLKQVELQALHAQQPPTRHLVHS
jgi:hypothetical protein